ncbi:YneF family protein [Planococcus glaciei]|nr:YneF family protein [Planococcus glaciei]QDY46758.1 YneF family protein [Planococcus glaciei]
MDTWIWILIVIVALLAGVALGFYIARRYMMKYLQDNPPINEEMLRIMMMQMGQKPSQKKINQMMAQMNKASTKPGKPAKNKKALT